MGEAMGDGFLPDIIKEAAQRKARRRKSRARLPLLMPKGLTLPPAPPGYNNYLAPEGLALVPAPSLNPEAPSDATPPRDPQKTAVQLGTAPAEAQTSPKRRPGAPPGNRHAAKQISPLVQALEAKIAAFIARAELVMAKALAEAQFRAHSEEAPTLPAPTQQPPRKTEVQLGGARTAAPRRVCPAPGSIRTGFRREASKLAQS